MICIDLGSGYNPKKGYKTCDVNAYCNYYDINEIKNNSVDVFHIRNVLHHVENLDEFISKIYKKLKIGGKIHLIDCSEEAYSSNLYLDRLWYRWITNRKDIYISPKYRDIFSYFNNNKFKIISNKKKNEKIILKIIKL